MSNEEGIPDFRQQGNHIGTYLTESYSHEIRHLFLHSLHIHTKAHVYQVLCADSLRLLRVAAQYTSVDISSAFKEIKMTNKATHTENQEFF